MHDQEIPETHPIAFQVAALSADAKDGVLGRTLALLEAVATSSTPPTIGDLVERLALPRATVYRLVEWLRHEGFLVREPARKRLVVGHRLSDLAINVLHAAVAMTPYRTQLEALGQETGETCHIGMIDDGHVIYLDRIESTAWPLQLHLPAGSRVPLHATAIGKLFLALAPVRERRALLAGVPLTPLTPSTITDRDRLEQELESVRRQGFAIDDQEFLPGVVAIAVPIVNRRGEIRAGLAIQAPEARMTVTAIRQHLPRLRKAAEQLRTFAEDFVNIPDRSPAPTVHRRGDQLTGHPDRAQQVEAEDEARENLEAALAH